MTLQEFLLPLTSCVEWLRTTNITIATYCIRPMDFLLFMALGGILLAFIKKILWG